MYLLSDDGGGGGDKHDTTTDGVMKSLCVTLDQYVYMRNYMMTRVRV